MATSRALVFFTVNNDDGARNPLSAQIIEALQKHVLQIGQLQRRGCAAIVLASSAGRPISLYPGSTVVALYDVNYGVNMWSPRPRDHRDNPGWAQELSTVACVAIGKMCLSTKPRVEGTVRQITVMFSHEHFMIEGHEYHWGPASKKQRELLKKQGEIAQRSTRGSQNGEGRSRHMPYFTRQTMAQAQSMR